MSDRLFKKSRFFLTSFGAITAHDEKVTGTEKWVATNRRDRKSTLKSANASTYNRSGNNEYTCLNVCMFLNQSEFTVQTGKIECSR